MLTNGAHVRACRWASGEKRGNRPHEDPGALRRRLPKFGGPARWPAGRALRRTGSGEFPAKPSWWARSWSARNARVRCGEWRRVVMSALMQRAAPTVVVAARPALVCGNSEAAHQWCRRRNRAGVLPRDRRAVAQSAYAWRTSLRAFRSNGPGWIGPDPSSCRVSIIYIMSV